MTTNSGRNSFFVDKDDQPWGTISVLAMLLPVVFVGMLSSLVAAVLRMRSKISVEKNLKNGG